MVGRTRSSGAHGERRAIAVVDVTVAIAIAIAVGSEEVVDLLWARRSKI